MDTANAIQCKSGEIFSSNIAVVCSPCGNSCEVACPHGSTVTSTNCVYRLLKLPLCECCCKMPPKPPPPSPPSPPPPPPSPPPPSPSPPPPSPSPPPPSTPPPPSCTEECPYEMELPDSPDQEQSCRYVLADANQIMME
ncbi:hypothetical protein C5167_002539 [Papaver somniferum]|uniref:Uncharacterized protein n=1 Tax=Papaver somniferum TaxID=3469 RepID=A0A4Y7KYH8_PAPSO|nr:hypothetical protein C5167_002539 [Papaver somniferum]